MVLKMEKIIRLGTLVPVVVKARDGKMKPGRVSLAAFCAYQQHSAVLGQTHMVIKKSGIGR